MLSTIKLKIIDPIINPGNFFRYRGAFWREFYWKSVKALASKNHQKRLEILKNIDSEPRLPVLDKEQGFAVLDPAQIHELTKDAVDEALKIIETCDFETIRKKRGKSYRVEILDQKEITKESALYKLASHPSMIKAVGDYLGVLPVLTHINIWQSPNDGTFDPMGSQMFHLDHEDLYQVKCFILLDEVTSDMGPLRVLSAQESRELCANIDYVTQYGGKRVSDEECEKYNVVEASGPKGTMIMADTSMCLHAGSNGTSGKPRRVLMFQYMTPYAYVAKGYRNMILSHLLDAGSSDYEKFLLKF